MRLKRDREQFWNLHDVNLLGGSTVLITFVAFKNWLH